MDSKEIIPKLEKEFSFLKKEKILGILLFGSKINQKNPNRDTDICIVAPEQESRQILKKVFQKINVQKKKYDVYCFEELPLYLRFEIIHNHKIIWTEDKGNLYEYFYYFRKLEQDQQYRMKVSSREIAEMLTAKHTT